MLATCLLPRRIGRGHERPETAERRGLMDAAICALLFHGALRRSEATALRCVDVEIDGNDDVVVTMRRWKVEPGGRTTRRSPPGWVPRVRDRRCDHRDGLGVDQVNRWFCGRLRGGRPRAPRALLVLLLGRKDYELPAQSGQPIRDLFQRGARQCEVTTPAMR